MGIQRRLQNKRGRPDLSRAIAEAKQGKTAAVDRLYRDHVGMVHGYFRANGALDPDDLTADVFVGLLRNVASFEGGPGEFRTWLMTIAHRRLVDARRRQAVRQTEPQPPQSFEGLKWDQDPEFAAIAVEPRLVTAFTKLTEAQREVLALRFLADLDLERVAAVTGRPVGAVKSMQYRALATLRAELSQQPGTSDEGAVSQ